MKKREIKKLRLSRETLRDLESSDARKVLGGYSPESNCLPETNTGNPQFLACYQP